MSVEGPNTCFFHIAFFILSLYKFLSYLHACNIERKEKPPIEVLKDFSARRFSKTSSLMYALLARVFNFHDFRMNLLLERVDDLKRSSTST
jgi:hypothetical protein